MDRCFYMIRDNYASLYDDNGLIDYLSASQQPLVDNCNAQLNQAFKNTFVDTADVIGIRKFERILNIRADEVLEDLEYRRRRIKTRLAMSLPFTRAFLISFLDEFLGRANYNLNILYNDYIIRIRFRETELSKRVIDDMTAILREIIPANMILDVRQLTRTWDMVRLEFGTWDNVAKKTWDEILTKRGDD